MAVLVESDVEVCGCVTIVGWERFLWFVVVLWWIGFCGWKRVGRAAVDCEVVVGVCRGVVNRFGDG